MPDPRLLAVATVDDSITRALAELRERAVARLMCHVECFDAEGHSDGCLYDDAESRIP